MCPAGNIGGQGREHEAEIDRISALEALLAEYRVERQRIDSRIATQRQVLFFALIVFGSIASAAIASLKNTDILMVIPLLMPFLYWSHREQSANIAIRGEYLNSALAEQIRNLAGNIGAMRLGDYRRQVQGDKPLDAIYHRRQVWYIFVIAPLAALAIVLIFFNHDRPTLEIVVLCHSPRYSPRGLPLISPG